MRSGLLGLLVAAPFVLGATTGSAAAPSGTPVFAFQDPAIVEASALVIQDGLFLTTNDSGDSGRVFAVNDTGETVGVTHWAAAPTDCEALAPAGLGYVWVGDIGDNYGHRATVSVTRVPVGHGDRTVQETTYQLSYPRGSPDAETLLRNPVTGRLFVATKNIFGGVLFALPKTLSATGTNRLHAVGHVPPVATDGSFFPDGRHLIVRTYTSATVYAWPSMNEVGSFALPDQPQGEGIAVAPDGSVYVSSEGLRSEVLEVSLPAAVERAVAPSGTPSSSSSPSQDPGPASVSDPSETDPTTRDAWPWLAGGLLGLIGLVVLLRALKPR